MNVNKLEKQLMDTHNHYYKRWMNLPDDFNDYDDFILELLNELEDLFNPSRLNGN